MTPQQRERVVRLWDALSELGATRIDGAVSHALGELAALVDAQQAFWLGTVRMAGSTTADPAAGWRPRAMHLLHPSAEFDAVFLGQQRAIFGRRASPDIAAKVAGAGRFRVLLHHEIVAEACHGVDLDEPYFELLGVRDVALVATPLGSEAESWCAFHRIGHDAPRFGGEERDMLTYALRPMQWFHRMVMLHYGIWLADEPLRPSERQVLQALQTDRSEAEIAAELGLTPATVHTYCTRIYRKFNVRGRAGLMALWFGQPPRKEVEEAP